jgi:hypothetical protein
MFEFREIFRLWLARSRCRRNGLLQGWARTRERFALSVGVKSGRLASSHGAAEDERVRDDVPRGSSRMGTPPQRGPNSSL